MRVGAVFALAGALTIATAAQLFPASASAEEKASDPRDRVICRRFARTGSLADSYRVCKTRWEWERERANIRQMGVSDSCRLRGDPGVGAGQPAVTTPDCGM